MAFMHLGGDAGAKPTYFEVYAADKLVPTLKSAIIYSLSVSQRVTAGMQRVGINTATAHVANCICLALQVLGQTHTWILPLLSYEDEVYAIVSLLLEQHSMSSMHATFAESLYGLKRQPARPGASSNSTTSSTNTSSSPLAPALSRRQQYEAVACQVGGGTVATCDAAFTALIPGSIKQLHITHV